MRLLEEERLQDIARIEASHTRIAELEDAIEANAKETDDEIQNRIASFREFEKSFKMKIEAYNEMLCEFNE